MPSRHQRYRGPRRQWPRSMESPSAVASISVAKSTGTATSIRTLEGQRYGFPARATPDSDAGGPGMTVFLAAQAAMQTAADYSATETPRPMVAVDVLIPSSCRSPMATSITWERQVESQRGHSAGIWDSDMYGTIYSMDSNQPLLERIDQFTGAAWSSQCKRPRPDTPPRFPVWETMCRTWAEPSATTLRSLPLPTRGTASMVEALASVLLTIGIRPAKVTILLGITATGKMCTQLLSTGPTTPQLEEWWQYIAYGAAIKVFQDRMDIESVALIQPEFQKQQALCLRRTIVQQTSQQVSTIYQESGGNGAGTYGSGWGYGGGQ